jgi:hypothetical protein
VRDEGDTADAWRFRHLCGAALSAVPQRANILMTIPIKIATCPAKRLVLAHQRRVHSCGSDRDVDHPQRGAARQIPIFLWGGANA